MVLSYKPKKKGDLIESKIVYSKEARLFKLKNVYIESQTTGVLNHKKSTFYYEKWHNDNKKIYLYKNKFIHLHSDKYAQIGNLSVNKTQSTGVFLGGTFIFNYFHFMMEVMSKVKYISSIPNIENYPILIDKCIAENTNFQFFISLFLPKNRIVYLKNNLLYRIEKLWYITSPNITIPNIDLGEKYLPEYTAIRESSVTYLRNFVLQHYLKNIPSIQFFSKIFLARKSKTRIYNQSEILEIALNYGFTAVYLEELSVLEQAHIMQNADYIVGPTGAAWTNLLFAKKNAKGLIWMSDVWGDFSAYSTIAHYVNFDLNYIIFEKKSNDFHENYLLDKEVFTKNIEKLLTDEFHNKNTSFS